jgi:hypothetical protein
MVLLALPGAAEVSGRHGPGRQPPEAAMTDLGNRNASMRLECGLCEWIPPADMKMEGVQLHFQVDHDTDEVQLNLRPVCTCGADMALTESRSPGPGVVKDYLACRACGNTGYIRRDEHGRPG